MIDLSTFHVIAVVSNPIRYKSRYELYDIFSEDIVRKGANLWTLELQTGKRFHQITKVDEKKHIQYSVSALPGELWHKENMINVAIQHLTRDFPSWRKVAWVDADIKMESGVISETAHALEHWDVVQMWSHATDFDSAGHVLNHRVHLSFMYCYWMGIQVEGSSAYLRGGHPGFAWAIRREALNKLGGLIDFGVLGSADRHMATGLVGRIHESAHGDCHPNYHKWLRVWQDRAEKNIRRNVGYVPGLVRHMWHGKKSDRRYGSRWKLLVDHQFNPETDIKKDVSGLWQLVSETPRQLRLRDDFRRYFRARNEDSK